MEIDDVVYYNDDAILIQPAESPGDEVWVSRDEILDWAPGDVEVEDAEEIELSDAYAYRRGLA